MRAHFDCLARFHYYNIFFLYLRTFQKFPLAQNLTSHLGFSREKILSVFSVLHWQLINYKELLFLVTSFIVFVPVLFEIAVLLMFSASSSDQLVIPDTLEYGLPNGQKKKLTIQMFLKAQIIMQVSALLHGVERI